jgi:hypothetical protein
LWKNEETNSTGNEKVSVKQEKTTKNSFSNYLSLHSESKVTIIEEKEN